MAQAYQKQNLNDKALDALNQGEKHLGLLPVLQNTALQIEITTANYNAALKRIESMLKTQQRQPILYERKGYILEKTGKTTQAKTAYKQAMEALEKIPLNRRNNQVMLTLQHNLKSKLN